MARIFRFNNTAAYHLTMQAAQQANLPTNLPMIQQGVQALLNELQKYGIGLMVADDSPYFVNLMQQYNNHGQANNVRPVVPRAPAPPQPVYVQPPVPPVTAQGQFPLPNYAPALPPIPGAITSGQPLPELTPPPGVLRPVQPGITQLTPPLVAAPMPAGLGDAPSGLADGVPLNPTILD